MKKPRMVSSGAAAALLGKDKRTIRRMVRDKLLRSYPTSSGRHRFRLVDLEALAGQPDSQRTPAGTGPSPALKSLEESVKELSLEIQRQKLQRDRRQLDEREQQEESERQAAAEEKRQQEAEERAQARREQAERDRQRALEGWRTQVIELAQVPDEAPAALRVAFYEKARQALAQFDCEQPINVVQALLVAIRDVIFGPWECQRSADARNAWIHQQTEQAWLDFSYTWRCERLGSAEQLQQDALHESLRSEVARALLSFTPDSPSAVLHQARRCAIDRALQPHREEKELRAAKERVDSMAQAATRELRPYLRQLRDTAWLDCEQNYLEIFAQDIEPRLLAFLQASGRKQPQFTPAVARQLLEDFVLRDLGLL